MTSAQLTKALDRGKFKDVVRYIERNAESLAYKFGIAEVNIVEYVLYKNNFELLEAILDEYKYKIKFTVETLLHAINIGNEEAVQTILKILRIKGINPEAEATESSRFFPPYMTAIMLGCLKNNYGIVKHLRESGHTIKPSHRAECACEDCRLQRKKGENMRSRERRLCAMRCLCSEAYLLQEGIEDPILESIMLSRDLEKCQDVEKEVAEKYEILRLSLSKVPTELLAECTSDEQVEKILKNPLGSSSECSISLPRLRLALDMHNKEFLADRRCQKVIENEWLGSWADWNFCSPAIRVYRVSLHTIFFFVASFLYIVTINRLPGSCRIPYARFLSSLFAHLFFIGCIVFNMQWDEPRDLRGLPDTGLKLFVLVYIWLYVFGEYLVLVTDLWRLGFRRYFDAWWHWYDMGVSLLYLITFVSFVIVCLTVSYDGIHRVHRAHWAGFDPMLQFEVLFASANIASTWRVFYYVQVNRALGPTVITIGRCIKDIFIYLLVIFLLMFSFALGLNFLYEHYKYNTVSRGSARISQPIFLTSMARSIRNLYWAFYGYLPPESMDIVVGHSGPSKSETYHNIISIAGELLIGIYYICIVIVMLNLMVSMMTGTAAKIMENEDLEWKYICSAIIAEFSEDSRSIPSPFNLLSWSINSSFWLLQYLPRWNKDAITSTWDYRYADVGYDAKSYSDYVQLMSLLKTKVMAKQTLKLAEGKVPEEKDIDEVTNEFGGDRKSWAGPFTPTKK